MDQLIAFLKTLYSRKLLAFVAIAIPLAQNHAWNALVAAFAAYVAGNVAGKTIAVPVVDGETVAAPDGDGIVQD